MPARLASSGEEKCTALPPSKIWPAVGAWTPAMHLISVDLPAPLSPTIAVISPLRAHSVISVRACTAPNHLLTCSTSRRTSEAGGVARPDGSFDNAVEGGLSAGGGVKGSFAFIVDTS